MTARLNIDITIESARWNDSLPSAEALSRHAAEAVWRREGDNDSDSELSIVLGDDTLLRSLNGRFRNRSQSTNVLSFPAEDSDLPGLPRLLGDVFLAFETVAREAGEQEKSLADHFQHLCVHGILHLLGNDHENDANATAMEALEIAILSTMGIGNPYADTPMKRLA